ncbi:MAG: DNA methylase [Cytophagales bacterium]|nr:MAG: DNA methylase [Cytophagales bacterium]
MSKEQSEFYKQSETITISRSGIKFAPYNPKKHTTEQVKAIKANLKRVAFLGGIVWNELTGNLIDGHKRVSALDLIHKYDGTPQSDYNIKVEKIRLDSKTEKEQNIFQTKSRTDLDNDLLADIIPFIDYELAGLSEFDLNMIAIEVPVFNISEHLNTVKDDFKALTEKEKAINAQTYEEKKQSIIDKKEAINQGLASETAIDKWVTVSFTNVEEKVAFMELLGYTSETKIIKGEPLLDIVAQLK